MSDALLSSTNILLCSDLPSNKLSYVKKQAISCDQVVNCISIRNSILIQWHSTRSKNQNYVDLLNSIIPDGSVRFKQTSERIKERVRILCWRAFTKYKKLSSKGSIDRRKEHLNGLSKICILASEIVPAADMEQEIQTKKRELKEMEERLNNVNQELEEWRQKFKNLEEEKEKLFDEMQEYKLKNTDDLNARVSCLQFENESMKQYVRKLERESDINFPKSMKDIIDLSKRQQKRRVEAVATRAEKALWFSQRFGLKIESLEFSDRKGQIHGWKSDKQTTMQNAHTPSPPCSNSTPVSNNTPVPIIADENPKTPSENHDQSPLPTNSQPQSKTKQYDSLSEICKKNVEAILFLMDKFSVGDAFVHEMSMIVDGMPRSYLIKQCRDKLNSTCAVKPTPGPEPGAQVSFRDALINKLKLQVSAHIF